MSGVPSTLTVWVSSAEAYAEVAFNDNDPVMNDLLLTALKANQSSIEDAFGGPLEWRSRDADGLMRKVAKVVTPKVSIGSRTEPTTEGLQALADVARRLVKAVEPYLRGCYDSASLAIVESEAADDVEAAEVVEAMSVDEVGDAEVVSRDGTPGRAPV